MSPSITKFTTAIDTTTFLFLLAMKIFAASQYWMSLPLVTAINGERVRLETFNGWKAFEVITEGDDPSGSWELPDDFDGAGAWIPGTGIHSNLLRIIVNHENSDATISEINIDLMKLKMAIANMIANGTIEMTSENANGMITTTGIDFVQDARQAYHQWSSDLGETWQTTSDSSEDTDFTTFCSGQVYQPNTFGNNFGFVDYLYITGEEVEDGRLFVLDLVRREIYQLSGVVGEAPDTGGNGGMPYDAWENAALVDTGETKHVALLLPPDGGSEEMQFYIGHKGKNKFCEEVFGDLGILERNGLACGSYYYLTGDLPDDVDETLPGGFSASDDDALSSGKLEDVDTFPDDPTMVVLGDETSGTFVFQFFLDFTSGTFNAGASSFQITKIVDQEDGSDDILNNADNVDWTAATTLGGREYPNGLIFINEDDEDGEVWQILPDGSNHVLVARADAGSGTTGIFDISDLVGFKPASILVCNNKGDPSSMSVLINPDAELLNGTLPTHEPTDFPTALPVPSNVPTTSPETISSTMPSLSPSSHPVDTPSQSPTTQPTVATPLPTSSMPTMVTPSIPSDELTTIPTSLPSSTTTGPPTILGNNEVAAGNRSAKNSSISNCWVLWTLVIVFLR